MTRNGKPASSIVSRRRLASGQLSAARTGRQGREDPAFERNIYSQLAGRLGQEIVAGVYPAGSLLPNAQDMCARFSVSRTALREAYSILSAKALILARPKIGTRIRPKSEWNLLDPEVLAWHLAATPSEHLVDELFALRQMVEPPAAALAAAAPSRNTVQAIADAYERMERFKNGEGDLIGADLDFHMAILQASGNRFLAALGGLIQTALECTFRLSWRGAGGNPGQPPVAAPRSLRGDPRRRSGPGARADGRAPARLDRRRVGVPSAARRGDRRGRERGSRARTPESGRATRRRVRTAGPSARSPTGGGAPKARRPGRTAARRCAASYRGRAAKRQAERRPAGSAADEVSSRRSASRRRSRARPRSSAQAATRPGLARRASRSARAAP